MDEDAVEIVHLDVGFQLDLLFAAQGAARCGGQRVDPLPAGLQHLPGRGQAAVVGGSAAVGHELGRQGFFLFGGLLAGRLQRGEPAAQSIEVCGSGLRGLLVLQGLHGSFGGSDGVFRSAAGGFGLLHAGAQGSALGRQVGDCLLGLGAAGRCGLPGFGDLLFQRRSRSFAGSGSLFGRGCCRFQGGALGRFGLAGGIQPGAAGAVGGSLLQGCAVLGLCGLERGGLLGKSRFQQGHGQSDRPLRRGEAFGQKAFGVPAEGGFALPLGGEGFAGGGRAVLRGAVCCFGRLLGSSHLRLGGGGVRQRCFGRVVDTAADGAGGAFGKALRQKSGLCVQKRPLAGVPLRVGSVLRGGCGAVGVLCLSDCVGAALVFGQALGQRGEGGLPAGKLLGLSGQGHVPGLRVAEGGRFGVQCGKFRIQRGQLGPRLAGFGLFEVGLAAGGGLCAAELVQCVAGVKARSGPLQLGGQSVQCGGIAGMAGRIGAGCVPAGEQGGKLSLFFDPLAAKGFGLLGPAQRLLQSVQLRLRGGVGGGSSGEFRFLPGEEPVQQGGDFLGGALRRKPAQRFGVGVGLRIADAGEHRVQLDILGRALGREAGVLLLQRVLQFLVALGAEQFAEDLAPLLGRGVEQAGELPLRDHGDLAELVVVQPDEGGDGGGDILRAGHGRAAVREGEDGVRLFGGRALAPRFGAEVVRVAADGVPLAAHLKFQLDKGGGAGGSVLAAQHGTVPHAAAGMVVQGIGDGVEKGGLARAGVAGDEIQAAFAQALQLQRDGAGVWPEGREGQLQRSHASSSFQSVSMSCWQNAACSALRG